MSTQPPLDSKLSLKPLDHSSLPSHDSFDAIFRDAQAVIDEAASWPAGKTYSDGLVQTATRKARKGEPLDWHTRLSKHADRSYDDMKRGLLLDHAKNESQYVPCVYIASPAKPSALIQTRSDLHTVERIEVIKPNEAESASSRLQVALSLHSRARSLAQPLSSALSCLEPRLLPPDPHSRSRRSAELPRYLYSLHPSGCTVAKGV